MRYRRTYILNNILGCEEECKKWLECRRIKISPLPLTGIVVEALILLINQYQEFDSIHEI